MRRAIQALLRTYTDVERNHTMQMAAALSYYFVLTLFPALIFLSAIVAYLPVPDLFNRSTGSTVRSTKRKRQRNPGCEYLVYLVRENNYRGELAQLAGVRLDRRDRGTSASPGRIVFR
jgi:hypothetical protein